jgi:acyl-CoA ligase (AMP-forming) (exosortase A-associated)
MPRLAGDLLLSAAETHGGTPALTDRAGTLDYAALTSRAQTVLGGLIALGIGRQERVAIYLDKRWETVAAFFGIMMAGCAMVPVNPVLKARQVGHILRDCSARVLITSIDRLVSIAAALPDCPTLRFIILTGGASSELIDLPANVQTLCWSALGAEGPRHPHRVIDSDLAAIFYTSGSTGQPKGVAVSHRNLVAGADSVNAYLRNSPDDRILAALPLSFDAGFSQLTTGFAAGARVILHNYFLPRDLLRALAEERITGLTGIPALFAQIAQLDWPDAAARSMRYLANTGGHMPRALLERLRAAAPQAQVFLMYGLTEAFRSTYLPPEELDRRPSSIGKAIPHAEILVVDEQGEFCLPGQTGELVHRGATVALGYWNDPAGTAARFRAAPVREQSMPEGERAVWSGDLVRQDEDGFLYFVGRRDDMIKTSGYRISPAEIEEIAHDFPNVAEVAAVGLADELLGQVVALAVTGTPGREPPDLEGLIGHFKHEVPSHMVPRQIVILESLPHGPNGKVDRRATRDIILAQMRASLS